MKGEGKILGVTSTTIHNFCLMQMQVNGEALDVVDYRVISSSNLSNNLRSITYFCSPEGKEFALVVYRTQDSNSNITGSFIAAHRLDTNEVISIKFNGSTSKQITISDIQYCPINDIIIVSYSEMLSGNFYAYSRCTIARYNDSTNSFTILNSLQQTGYQGPNGSPHVIFGKLLATGEGTYVQTFVTTTSSPSLSYVDQAMTSGFEIKFDPATNKMVRDDPSRILSVLQDVEGNKIVGVSSYKLPASSYVYNANHFNNIYFPGALSPSTSHMAAQGLLLSFKGKKFLVNLPRGYTLDGVSGVLFSGYPFVDNAVQAGVAYLEDTFTPNATDYSFPITYIKQYDGVLIGNDYYVASHPYNGTYGLVKMSSIAAELLARIRVTGFICGG